MAAATVTGRQKGGLAAGETPFQPESGHRRHQGGRREGDRRATGRGGQGGGGHPGAHIGVSLTTTIPTRPGIPQHGGGRVWIHTIITARPGVPRHHGECADMDGCGASRAVGRKDGKRGRGLHAEQRGGPRGRARAVPANQDTTPQQRRGARAVPANPATTPQQRKRTTGARRRPQPVRGGTPLHGRGRADTDAGGGFLRSV